MKNSEKKWLEAGSWDALLTIHQGLCEAQKLEPLLRKPQFTKAQQYWQTQISKVLSLPEALDACRKCNGLQPFMFNTGNTFAKFSQGLIHNWAETLPAVQAQILRTTVAHYVNGQASRKELLGILDFLGGSWDQFLKASVIIHPETLAPAPVPEEPMRELVAS